MNWNSAARYERIGPRNENLMLGQAARLEVNDLERFGITYPNGPDTKTRIAQSFRIRAVPETFFIDRNGRVAFMKIGPFTGLESIISIIEDRLGS